MTYERAHELFWYNEETGKLHHKYWKGLKSVLVDKEVGCHKSRHPTGGIKCLRIKADGKRWRYHRIVWLMKTGRFPLGELDHIDRDPSNNRFTNLREVTSAQNADNRSRTETTGVRVGSKGGWVASICMFGKKTEKYCKTKQEAIEQRRLWAEEKRQIYWGYAEPVQLCLV